MIGISLQILFSHPGVRRGVANGLRPAENVSILSQFCGDPRREYNADFCRMTTTSDFHHYLESRSQPSRGHMISHLGGVQNSAGFARRVWDLEAVS